MRKFTEYAVQGLISAAVIAAAVFAIDANPAAAGQYVDGHYVYSDNFGNLVIQRPGSYKQIVIGKGYLVEQFQGDQVKAEPSQPPTVLYRNRDEYEPGEEASEERRYVVIGPESGATCVGGATVLRGRSFMYGVPRGVTPSIGNACR